MTLNCWKFKGWKSKGWTVCAIALVSFAAGSLITARLAHINQVRADSNRVFELRVYHCLPGKVPALESRFRDTTSKLLAKHDLKAVGYWVTEGDAPAWDNTFIFILAHPSREEAKRNWEAAGTDPGFQEVYKSEQANKLVEKVDSTYHASYGFFADEVVPDLAKFDSPRQSSLTSTELRFAGALIGRGGAQCALFRRDFAAPARAEPRLGSV